jgi:hypothetical protein
VNGPKRSGADGWSDVEQRFFADAPPDVPLQPPAPPSFDDLVDVRPERRRGARAAWRSFRAPRVRATRVRWSATRRAWTRGVARVRAFFGWLYSWLERTAWPATVRAIRRGVAFSVRTWRELAPARRVARSLAERGLRILLARLVAILPAERPDRGALLAAVAVLAVVIGLSATMLASHGPWLTFVR